MGGDMPKLAAAKLDEEAAEKLRSHILRRTANVGDPPQSAAAVGSGGHRSRPHLRNSTKADLTARFSKFDINTAQPEQSSLLPWIAITDASGARLTLSNAY